MGKLRRKSAILALMTLWGCAAGPTYQEPIATSPPTFVGSAEGADVADLEAWWNGLNDPSLSYVVGVALGANLDIAQARARLTESRALLAQSRAGLLPSVSGGASVSRTKQSTGLDNEVYGNNIDARWTLDLFGAARRNTEAARANADAAEFSLQNVRIAVAAETARTYVDLRTVQSRLAIARDTLTTQNDNLEIARFRNQAGLVSALDVDQARAQRALTASNIPTLERAAATAHFRLAVLAGEAPGALDDQLTEGAIPIAPEVHATGLPADLLRRRPDVRIAERNLAAATARIGVAEAQLFPTFALSGSVASNAARLSALNDAWTTTLIGAISQPIFQGGALRAVVRQRKAAAEGALFAYRAAVLGALEDVEVALAVGESAQARVVLLQEQADAAARAAELARINYRAGLIDFQRLLESERSLLNARDSLASAQGDVANAAIQLYLALGGGWTPPSNGAKGDTHE